MASCSHLKVVLCIGGGVATGGGTLSVDPGLRAEVRRSPAERIVDITDGGPEVSKYV